MMNGTDGEIIWCSIHIDLFFLGPRQAELHFPLMPFVQEGVFNGATGILLWPGKAAHDIENPGLLRLISGGRDQPVLHGTVPE